MLLNTTSAYASGGYVLEALIIDFFILISFTIFLFKVNITWKQKGVLLLSYLTAMFVLFSWINQIDYLSNLTLINVGSAILPLLVVGLTYWLILKVRKNAANKM